MALIYTLSKAQGCYIFMYFGRKLLQTYSYNQRCSSNNSMLLEVDTIDGFTTQLMQKKINNWEMLARRRKLLKDHLKISKDCLNTDEHHIEVNKLTDNKLNNTLKDAVDNYNTSLLRFIIDQCIELNRLPNTAILLQVVSLYSALGDKNSILRIKNLCEKLQPSFLEANSNFLHYLAEATWIKGNIKDAVAMFETVYRNNTTLRNRIRCMLKSLIINVIPNHSEAALIIVISFVERLANEFKDFVPLMYIWRLCFLSEWYSDQCLAIELLQRHSDLYEILSTNLTQTVGLALKNNQMEVVYRLLEVLLKSKQNMYYGKVLEVIFDHRVHRGDLRGCTEIMQWAVNQNVDLPALQQEKFINLLLAYKVGLRRQVKYKAKEDPEKSTSLSYKF